jgi:hypothetical protein
MPNQKISELTTIVTVDNAVDLFPIVDTSANTTKKITPTALKSALALDNVNNTSDANKPVSTAQQDALNAKVTGNTAIVAATKTKITYDAKGLVTAGDILDAADMPTGINAANIGAGVVSSTEFGYLDGVTSAIQTQLNAKQATLVSGTNIKTINSTSLLGSGDITISASPSGVAGAIQFSNGSAFASDAANLFWDDTNNRLGVGTNAPTATTDIFGVNFLSNSYSLKVSNSVSQGILSVSNDGYVQVGDFSGQGYGANMAFLRPSGATIATTFSQGNQNLSIQNVNGNVTFQNTQVRVIGSGSTSATTSLLVQNSAGTAALTVKDDCSTNIGASGISARLNIVNTNGSVAAFLAGSGNGGVIEFNSASGAGIRFNDGFGNTNMFVAGLSTPSVSMGKTTAAVASALLEMESTTKGFLPPRMTTTQKNAIATPSSGLVVYDSTTNKLCCYNGSTWNDLF